MRVVADDDDQRIVAPGGEGLGRGDGVVEHDGVVDRALPVERVAVLVDQARLHHQHEPVGLARQDVDRRPRLVDEVGLVGIGRHGALLEHEAVERAVEVAGMEQAEQLRRRLVGGGGLHLRGRGREPVARRLELLEVVLLVLALAGLVRLRQEEAGAAAHHHVGLDLVEHAHDLVVVAAAAHVRDHAGGRRVLDLGVGDDAYAHAAVAALHQLGDGLDLGVGEAVLVARAIDAHGVDARLVAGRVGAHGVGGIGDERVASPRWRRAPCAACRRWRARRRSGPRPGPWTARARRCGAPRTGRRR